LVGAGGIGGSLPCANACSDERNTSKEIPIITLSFFIASSDVGIG